MATFLPMNYSNGSAPLTPSKHLSLRFSVHLSSKKTRRWLGADAVKLPRYHSLQLQPLSKSKTGPISATMATGSGIEVLPPVLTSNSEPPPVFDGTTRLYVSYSCPYAQRVWITRNCKGLQDKIKLVPIDLQDRPAWYKEKVYPPNKVPSLEHNNEVKGESLDLIKYIDSHFDGPSLFPDDPAKKEFAEELFSYTDSAKPIIPHSKERQMKLVRTMLAAFDVSLSSKNTNKKTEVVDIAYAPFIERFQPALLEFKKYDVTAGRPKLAAWIEEMNKIEAYNQTRRESKQHVETYKKRFAAHL
ncbi:hypothetical protein POTOM_029308 [Populus tomentosa]|uniref:GST N-terminal domain-containing protein n=1 Tax=Populus tomentosa TaxID=118781 RepID=A0A8X7Z9S4_POPTO|nr:hypothetical protein POTOM_029308 [Populus tomentosa]